MLGIVNAMSSNHRLMRKPPALPVVSMLKSAWVSADCPACRMPLAFVQSSMRTHRLNVRSAAPLMPSDCLCEPK